MKNSLRIQEKKIAGDGVEASAGSPPKGSTPYAPDATIGSIAEELGARERGYVWRVLVAAGITLSLIVVLWFVWQVLDILLIVFAGILLAVFLRSLANWLSHITPLSVGWSLAVVLLVLIALIGLGLWYLAPALGGQVNQLIETLPQSVEQLRQYIEAQGWGQQLTASLPSPDEVMPNQSDLLSRLTGVFSTTLGALTNLMIIFFIGVYMAAQPRLYINGFIRLFPIAERERIREVVSAVGSTLQRWLIGRVIGMVVIGLLTTLGLWLLGIPLALILGLLAGLSEFVPYIGPLVALVPALLLGLLEGPTTALYILLLFSGIQLLESYLLTPLIERQAVYLPPAMTITVQLAFGLLIGGLGLLIATPLSAAVMVIIQMLYIQDTLKDYSKTA
jgi:predicted PurR-regulated permease PerM